MTSEKYEKIIVEIDKVIFGVCAENGKITEIKSDLEMQFKGKTLNCFLRYVSRADGKILKGRE